MAKVRALVQQARTAGSPGGERPAAEPNAVVWDITTGRRVASYHNVVSAAWWWGKARGGRKRAGKKYAGVDGWFVVATPDRVEVLPAPGQGRGTAEEQGAEAAAIAVAYYHVQRVEKLVLGTGDLNWLTFAISDGTHVRQYALRTEAPEVEKEPTPEGQQQQQQQQAEAGGRNESSNAGA